MARAAGPSKAPAEGYLLALDAGIGGGRCLIFSREGHLRAYGYREWSVEGEPGVPGGLGFDSDRYWSILTGATRDALASGGIHPDWIASISVTCQREGFLLLDDADRVLYAGPSGDMRGLEANAQLAAEHGAELYAITGHVPDTIHMPGRLCWLKQHRPAVFARGRRLMMINDWMLYRLSGVWTGEPSNGCSSVLFDVRIGDWSDRALELVGVRRDLFPPIVPSGTRVGELHRAAAAETGLTPGTPVVAGGGDGQCGLLGAGAVNAGDVAAIAGTTTPVMMELDRPQFDDQRRTWTRSGLDLGRWALEANAGITGLAFRWVRDLLHEIPTEDSYAAMVRLADGVPVGSRGTRSFLGPKLMKSGWLATLGESGSVSGIGPFGGRRPEIIRATMESICYAVRANCELLEEVSGQRITALRMVGGQSRSASWAQMQADILGKPVLIPPVTEASGWGAAMCAGLGVGYWSSLSEAVRVSTVGGMVKFEPQTDAAARYSVLYPAWVREVSPT